MKTAEVKSVTLNNEDEIIVTIKAANSMFIEYPKQSYLGKLFINSAPLVEGINLVLKQGHHAVEAIKGNKEFMELTAENDQLRKNIRNSELAYRVRQLLSCLDYDKLSDFQAKVVLLVERELGSTTQQTKS